MKYAWIFHITTEHFEQTTGLLPYVTGFSSSVFLSASKNSSRGFLTLVTEAEVENKAEEDSDLVEDNNTLRRSLDMNMVWHQILQEWFTLLKMLKEKAICNKMKQKQSCFCSKIKVLNMIRNCNQQWTLHSLE